MPIYRALSSGRRDVSLIVKGYAKKDTTMPSSRKRMDFGNEEKKKCAKQKIP